jgi:sporulation protein YlmC with PRC-barrel domain
MWRQQGNQDTKQMKRATLASSAAACLCLVLTTPLLAAEPVVTGAANHSSSSTNTVSAPLPAAKCLSNLRTLDSQMGTDGYWLGGSGYGYGYPVGGYGYEYGDAMRARPATAATSYEDARPGYEVRILVAAANILAHRGQQQACESVLSTARGIYKVYVADMHRGGMPRADVPGWQQHEIAAAQPVTAKDTSYRSDELVGIDVRTPRDDALGSVEDLVMGPRTGKIAYVVIGLGGVFGIDEKYVPVPWDDFKVTQNVDLLVLDSTKAVMDAAPHVTEGQFTTQGKFDQESQKVDAYWKAHLSSVMGSK